MLYLKLNEDLSFLNLLPDNQAQSIAEKLGVQTGKPLNDEVVMDTIDHHLFQASKPKNIRFEIDIDENK